MSSTLAFILVIVLLGGLCVLGNIMSGKTIKKNSAKLAEQDKTISGLEGKIDELENKVPEPPKPLTLEGIDNVLKEMGYETKVLAEEGSIVFKRHNTPYKIFAQKLPTILVTLTFNIDDSIDFEVVKQAAWKATQGILYPTMEFNEQKAFRFCVYQIEFTEEHLKQSLPFTLDIIDRTMGIFDFAYKDIIRQKNEGKNTAEKPQITIPHNPGISS